MSALEDLLKEQEENDSKELEAIGLDEKYGAFRESLPDGRMDNREVKDLFLWSQDVEEGAESGALKAISGGQEVGVDTTPPGTGPDDEETGPDEAGEVSEGGDEDPGDQKLEIEGLWKPPEDSTAENYEPPTTSKMVATPDWTDNARRLWESAGEPEFRPYAMTPGQEAGPPTDEEIAKWAEREIQMFNWNVASTMTWAKDVMTSNDPKKALAFLNLLEMYDHSDGGLREGLGAINAILMDPTTYTGLGVGSLASKGAAKAFAKQELKKALQLGIQGSVAGAMEGGMLGGGFDLARQSIEKEAGTREEISGKQAAIATGLGAGAGALLGGGIGYGIGRHLDKLREIQNHHLLRLQGLTEEETRRELAGRSVDELSEMAAEGQRALQMSNRAEDQDAVGTLLMMADAQDIEVPRDPDGRIQVEELARKLRGDEDSPKMPSAEVPMDESQALAQKLAELDELEKGELLIEAPGRPGSRVATETGETFKLVGRTKNGWYKVISEYSGEEKNFRRHQFHVVEKAPTPTRAGPMDLSPFSTQAARVIAMAESIHGDTTRIKETRVTMKEIHKLVDDMEKEGISLDARKVAEFWTPAELAYLRDTYNRMAGGMGKLATSLERQAQRQGITDADLAYFNAAHSQFVAVRDLFYGVRGNAARMMRVLRERPRGKDSYDFSKTIVDSLMISGGKNNTIRAIKLMAKHAENPPGSAPVHPNQNIHAASVKIWGARTAEMLLQLRYNMMLSSWRTHFFNFLGNSASGMYEHFLVSPIGGLINNAAYARQLAAHKVLGKHAPDPATRYTRKTFASEFKGHRAAFRDSIALAKAIALGHDIGEGKVYNELGLRYDIVNVPQGLFGKLGTTPVRMLEAGDALFKNQYYMGRLHYLADQKARADEIYEGMDYEVRYNKWVNEPEASMEREARDWAAKMTYTNEANVYEGILSNLARAAASAQSGNLVINMFLPFVRTPANLLGYASQMTGVDALLSHSSFIDNITSQNYKVRNDAHSKLLIAAGLWTWVTSAVQDGSLTGAGPTNHEEYKAWEKAGHQKNSIKIADHYVDLSRAAPAGQALTMMATVVEQLTVMNIDEKEGMALAGAALLATLDQLKDENYMSTISDFIVAVESKDPGWMTSVLSSTASATITPNLARDFRRVQDPVVRSMRGPDMLNVIWKQMMNAYPGSSENVPPTRDWKGDVRHYFGNAYMRAIIPFNLRNAEEQDLASMALAYAGVPISTPPVKLDMKGEDNFLNLYAMDNGDGYVYDKYVELVGKARKMLVNEVINHPKWERLVRENNVGPGSEGEQVLSAAINKGSRLGKAQFLEFLIEHSDENSTFKRADGKEVTIQHRFDVKEYKKLLIDARKHDISVPKDKPQYEIRERREGVEFFKP